MAKPSRNVRRVLWNEFYSSFGRGRTRYQATSERCGDARSNMAAANLVAAQSDAMRIAAGNANGAANGFIGLGLANMTGGTDAGRLFTDAATSFHHSGSFNQQNWTCSCGVKNSGNFCQNCGKERCSDSAWTCPSCGTSSAGNYCSQCGKARTQP